MNIYLVDGSRGTIEYRAFLDSGPVELREEPTAAKGRNQDVPNILITSVKCPSWNWVRCPPWEMPRHHPYSCDDTKAFEEAERRICEMQDNPFAYYRDDLQARIDAAGSIAVFHSFRWTYEDGTPMTLEHAAKAFDPNARIPVGVESPYSTMEEESGATAVAFLESLKNFPIQCNGIGEILGMNMILPLEVDTLPRPKDDDEKAFNEWWCYAGFHDGCERFKAFVLETASRVPGSGERAAAFIQAFVELVDTVENGCDDYSRLNEYVERVDAAHAGALDKLKAFHVTLAGFVIENLRPRPDNGGTKAGTPATREDVRALGEKLEGFGNAISEKLQPIADDARTAAACGNELRAQKRLKSKRAKERSRTAVREPLNPKGKADVEKALARVHERVENGEKIMDACRWVCKRFTALTTSNKGGGKDYAPLMGENGKELKPDTLAKYYRTEYPGKRKDTAPEGN